MIIIGIDTAIRKTGYGVLEMAENGDVRVLDCGVIQNPQSLPHSGCLRRLAGGVRQLVDAFHPEVAAIETAFAGKNVRTTMILSLARGAVIAALAECSVPVYEYAPKTAKRAATGLGTADKVQVAGVLANFARLNVSDIPLDATDALALAFCHGNLALRSPAGEWLGTPV